MLIKLKQKKPVLNVMNRLLKKLEKIGRDPKTTAKAAGLRYVSDSNPGYTRKKAGKGWSYYN